VETGTGVNPDFYSMDTGAFSTGVKRQGCEADHSSPTSVEVKKAWIYTSTPPYIFIFIFTFTFLPIPVVDPCRRSKTIWVPQKTGNFTITNRLNSLSRRVMIHGVSFRYIITVIQLQI
jgi:hypothetical protein